MADIELNKLGIKSDSLPNDWYVSLISPKAGQPAEIMIQRTVTLSTGIRRNINGECKTWKCRKS